MIRTRETREVNGIWNKVKLGDNCEFAQCDQKLIAHTLKYASINKAATCNPIDVKHTKKTISKFESCDKHPN